MNKSCMSNQMNIEELKTIIASKVKEIGLHDVLDAAAIEKIKNKVMGVYNHEKASNSIPEVIPEAAVAGLGNTEIGMFPEKTSITGGTAVVDPNKPTTGSTPMNGEMSIEAPSGNYDSTIQPGQNIDAGTTGNIPAYKPELPSFMDKIEPAKVIVFSQNELSEGGENLSNKPLRTFSDPDVKESMNDFWLDKGQKRAEVYMAKLEKIGELEFDYANGTTKFVEKRFEPDFEAQAKYKENPYMADNAGPATPGDLDINGQPNIMTQVANSVDIEKVVSDIVMNILRNQLMTNTTRAVGNENEPHKYSLGALNPNEPNRPTDNQGYYVSESFNLKMIDLVNEYEKIDTPANLKEAIDKNDKKFLVKENEEVQEWLIEGRSYFTPVIKMSTRKCYIKS
jgi:hypothetical protein